MNKKIPILIFFFFLLGLLQSQNLTWDWAKNYGNNDSEVITDIASDSKGNIYAVGYFDGDSTRFGNFLLTNPISSIDYKLMIIKFDKDGNVIWARTTITGESQANTITIDSHDNLIVGGIYFSNIKFETWFTLPRISSIGSDTDIFLAKFDSDGDFIWAKSAGSDGKGESITEISSDKNDNIYCYGSMNGSASFGGINLVNTNSIVDVFLVKYDSSGVAQWGKNVGGSCTLWTSAIATDSMGNSYITGTFYNSSVTFGSYTLPNSGNGNKDGFIAKYDNTGNTNWAIKVGGLNDDVMKDITLDYLGFLYVSGSFNSNILNIGTYSLNNYGNRDAFLLKMNTNSDILWVNHIGSNREETGGTLNSDLGSNIYMNCNYDSILTIGSTTHINYGGKNYLVVKTNFNGDIESSIDVKGIGNNYVIDPVIVDNNLYESGSYWGGNMIYGSDTIYKNNNGTANSFLSKLNLGFDCNSLSSLLIDSCGLEKYVTSTLDTVSPGTFFIDTLINISSCDSLISIFFLDKYIDTTISIVGNGIYSNELNGATYQWLDCNNGNAIIIGETNQSYSPISSGDYAVVVSKNGCTDTTACINVILTGINELENSFVKISPNPTTTDFIIELAEFSPTTKINIVSVEGKTVYTNNTINTNKIVVNAANWSNGVYMVKITDKQSSNVVKLIKQ